MLIQLETSQEYVAAVICLLGTVVTITLRYETILFLYATLSVLLQQQLLLHPFNGLFSRTTWVSHYQKGKTSLDLNEAREDGVLLCIGIG